MIFVAGFFTFITAMFAFHATFPQALGLEILAMILVVVIKES